MKNVVGNEFEVYHFISSIKSDLRSSPWISINNYHAGYAAGAYYPCLTIPMGYNKDGKPFNLTFISQSFTENKLLQIGYAFEKETNYRIIPF